MPVQLQEFAKQVLFGTTIEEKLSFPREEIIDTKPGAAIKTPGELTRPSHLALREDGVKANHPSQAKLVDERERGRLLHFFGNHELLATELMALAILKFPDAPASFRRGLLETLKDEQIHTRIYMHRMKQCGVEFGELPLSDYFWKSVSSMEDPLDYVTRLSLTFEQANLDYSREYGRIFDQVGDKATANILDRIYRDEIDHVGFGLKWFRKWKAAGKSDWEAYRERLVFPLSPSRAKGNPFNADGRREVGFDPCFIREMQVFNQSRGRTPDVYWFNPDAERYAAADQGTPSEVELSSVQRDLEFLPAYLARQDDLLITSAQPSVAFLQRLQDLGFTLPEIQIVDTSKSPLRAPALDRKLGVLRPWAWAPDSISFLTPTFPALSRPVEVDSCWTEALRRLYSKSWSSEWGRSLASRETALDWLAPCEVYGHTVFSLEEVEDRWEQLQCQGYRDLVCKAPFGTAANAMRRLACGEPIPQSTGNWLENTLAEQGSLVVEPWLDRVFDFSLQLEMRGSRLDTVGFTRLINNARGQFQGIVLNAFTHGLDKEIVRFLMQRERGKPRVYQWYEASLNPLLSDELISANFQGPIGIDAFVYREHDGRLRLKSVVEVNPRVTMGRIALEAGRHIAPNSAGLFQIVTRTQLKKSGAKGLIDYARSLETEHPTVKSQAHPDRIRTGTIPLTDPSHAQQFLALLHVRKQASELPITL
ncbi:DUF455 family protein [Pelagicoccus sp. SDUM812003]|uniref:DUF455 family protein n=1 Tax=Pelagicoccus sp. SDUM812003 TaxID=3041267 RepID=UPI00280DF1FB|nr:DUF455 family protein [Pelagicoccus sp. SDUM812003]MDQ8202692.1 DUF455 family protein [Pelagicoccus sp. SDUM812003]